MSTSTSPENPIKLFLKVVLFIAFYFALCIALHGCKAKPTENKHEVETVIASKKDSIKTTVISGAINDTLKIQLPKVQTAKPECDSITKVEILRVLQLLDSRKKSGDNETGIYYDSLRNQIIAWQKIAQTKNVNIATNKEYIHIKGDKQIKYISVKYIPLWVKILASIGVMTLLFIVYRISRIFI
ncbi:hypothetical protein [Flavobacterium hydatis]|jgi:biopolymer transport protein ExbD|uniref:Uncharacterized protein n=1 Tax=Flavobacterium hydatis TaxID=991 RepID=A0A086AL08_FLAHY|nr:hypothetical protein [Flavobacterium hydatis]KFF17372.1 hypothetical protein IW20_08525 [Flavobacterium hydatis]OXA97329.1 hypothetical protein B0A62_03515 [Flavobacterium hydatis]